MAMAFLFKAPNCWHQTLVLVASALSALVKTYKVALLLIIFKSSGLRLEAGILASTKTITRSTSFKLASISLKALAM